MRRERKSTRSQSTRSLRKKHWERVGMGEISHTRPDPFPPLSERMGTGGNGWERVK